jgi:hypothetical protein
MKRNPVLALFLLSLAWPNSAQAQIYQGADSAQRAQHAAKKSQKRAAKKQRKAAKKYRKAQSNAAKQQKRRS